MKEHKRLADEQPEDGQVCEVSYEREDGITRSIGEVKWIGKFFYHDWRGVFFGEPERIWWRVRGSK